MILLDTDHASLLKYPEGGGARLVERLKSRPPGTALAVSIVTVEELASVAKERVARRQVLAYSELARLFEYFRSFTIALFDDRAADQFDALRIAKIRLGTMDLKIAAIALVTNATLLTANRRDFEWVPGLKVENWLD